MDGEPSYKLLQEKSSLKLLDEVQDIDDSGRHLIYELIDVPFMLVGSVMVSVFAIILAIMLLFLIYYLFS